MIPTPRPGDGPNSAYWRPAICDTLYGKVRPPVDVLIGHRGKAYRVVRVEDVNPGNWHDRAREMWLAWKMPDPWTMAPFRVVVTAPEGGQDLAMTVQPWMHVTWHVLPEHYAVCVKCGDLSPCGGHAQVKAAEYEMSQAEAAMAVLPGCCPACTEPITSRQKYHEFPGENLLNPLAEPGVRFHQRRQCRHGAKRYEEMWVAADPRRERSLLTLKCDGTLVVHGDGTAECHGAPECPTVYARHRGYTACVAQTHGCPRDCDYKTHPGFRLAKGLTKHGTLPEGLL